MPLVIQQMCPNDPKNQPLIAQRDGMVMAGMLNARYMMPQT
jgi:hypothetical protein